MSYRTKTLMFLALAAIVFFCGAAGGWLAQGMLKDAEIANLKAEHSAQDLAVTNQALADSASFQKGIYDALQTAIILGQQNATAAASMQNSLAGVQSVVKRLSGVCRFARQTLWNYPRSRH